MRALPVFQSKKNPNHRPQLLRSGLTFRLIFIPDRALYAMTHDSDTAVLDLLDWEERSRKGLQQASDSQGPITSLEDDPSCRPPPGVSTTCCLGSFSTGSRVKIEERHLCKAAFVGHLNQWELMKQEVNRTYGENAPPNSNGMSCDVCQIVELARFHNLNISLLGDSIHSQVATGFICELQRRGYRVNTTESNPMGIHRLTDKGRNFGHNVRIDIQSPTWPDGTTVQIRFYLLYLFPVTNISQPYLDDILRNTQVLYLGMGMHWKHGAITFPIWKKEAMAPAMSGFFEQAIIAQDSAIELLVQRETSYQHFDYPSGDYADWHFKGKKSNRQCTLTPGPTTQWKEEAVDQALANHSIARIYASPHMPPKNPDQPEIVTAPYLNFSSLFSKMHPTKEPEPDCTHFCGSPFTFMTQWRYLRLAMDRQYFQHSD